MMERKIMLIEQRISRLEAAARRWKLAAATLTALILFGAVAPEKPGPVRGTQFLLVDGNDKTIATLHRDPAGSPVLRLQSIADKSKIELGLDDRGRAAINLL